PRAAVGAVHLALDQPLFCELLDQHAGRVAIDVDPLGESVLIDAWFAAGFAEVEHHSVLKRTESRLPHNRGRSGHTDLVKATRDGGWHAVPWWIGSSCR